jgi:hypothetical protein
VYNGGIEIAGWKNTLELNKKMRNVGIWIGGGKNRLGLENKGVECSDRDGWL